jgi:hypothetical protein
MQNVCDQIRQSISRLLSHDGFKNWLRNENVEAGDHILVNNSFVFRDVSTTKSEFYLAMIVNSRGKVDPDDPKIASGIRINSDFRRYSCRSRNLPTLIDLDQAVASEISKLGSIIFLLIGQVKDDLIFEEQVNHSAFGLIRWDPSISQEVDISGNRVTVRDAYNEDEIWRYIEEYFRSQNQNVPSGLHEAISIALDKLQIEAIADVEIPPFGAPPPKEGITDAIVQALREHRKQYGDALNQYQAGQSPSALNEILRIAYNFATDATKYIRLIVSICDLKPIVLWGTIAEHYALSEEFKSLPRTRSQKKALLSEYESIIADARNSAFHHLFPFRKTLRASVALQKSELFMFSEHTRRGRNQLVYQDKELIDLFLQFTRAREARPPDRFWQQNLRVIDATINLFERTSDFLKSLHSAMGHP